MASGTLSQDETDDGTTNIITCLNINLKYHEDPLNSKDYDTETPKHWDLSLIGIKENPKETDDVQVLQNFTKTVSYDETNEQYTVRLPWRIFPPEDLPTNYGLAYGRYLTLLRKLDANLELRSQYKQVCQQETRNSFIEKVPLKVLREKLKTKQFHVLAQLPVTRADSASTPLRRVLDCSARLPGQLSLNDCLHSGPSLVPLLLQILLRIRLFKFLLLSDVSKAFLRLILDVHDRDYTWFFMRRDWEDPNSQNEVWRFRVVLFGSTSSPFLLQAVIQYHLTKMRKEHLGENLYVDNQHLICNSVKELKHKYHETEKTFKKAGLPFRDWLSNDESLNQYFREKGLIMQDSQNAKILGMQWNVSNDKLSIKQPLFDTSYVTKRTISSDIGRIYDPLGIYSPITVQAKLILQTLWVEGKGWDEQVSDNLLNEWVKLTKLIELNLQHPFPRFVAGSDSGPQHLHAFADAAQRAYGGVMYIVNQKGVQLYTAKGRVAPIRQLTIPKLEILASTITSRYIKFICEALPESYSFTSIHLWLDSQCCLNWLTSGKAHKSLYIRNRVK